MADSALSHAGPKVEPFEVMRRTLWRSTDHGQTWARVDATAARDVVVAPDGTTLVLTEAGVEVLE